jgi:lipoprotein signal peptidase
LLTIVWVFTADQAVKTLARAFWDECEAATLTACARIGGPHLFLAHVENDQARGMALGSVALAGAATFVLALWVVVALAMIVLLGRGIGGGASRWSAALLVGGHAGNYLDVLRHGSITDVLGFSIGRYAWVGNPADLAHALAGILLAYAGAQLIASRLRAAGANARANA